MNENDRATINTSLNKLSEMYPVFAYRNTVLGYYGDFDVDISLDGVHWSFLGHSHEMVKWSFENLRMKALKALGLYREFMEEKPIMSTADQKKDAREKGHTLGGAFATLLKHNSSSIAKSHAIRVLARTFAQYEGLQGDARDSFTDSFEERLQASVIVAEIPFRREGGEVVEEAPFSDD